MSDKPPSGPRVRQVPNGDNRERLVCPDCGYIVYDNPKVVVGAVCTWEEKILLCRRAIEPRKGHWTFPAGFMELNESTQEGAAREVWEEACASIHIDGLLGIYEIPWIGQVCTFYHAHLTSADFAPGEESLETALFERHEIPWDSIAFPSIRWALACYEKRAEGPCMHVAERTSLDDSLTNEV